MQVNEVLKKEENEKAVPQDSVKLRELVFEGRQFFWG